MNFIHNYYIHMNFETESTGADNPFAEAEKSPWRVVGVYADAESGDEEQEHIRYASDEVSARRLLKELQSTDPDMNWRVEDNPDYTETPEAA